MRRILEILTTSTLSLISIANHTAMVSSGYKGCKQEMKEIDKIVFDARIKLAEETVIKQKSNGGKGH